MNSDELPELSSLGARVRAVREDLGLTQMQLAKLARVSQGTIGNVEAGLRDKPRDLLAIAAALQVSPDWLAAGRGPKHGQFVARGAETVAPHADTLYLPGFEQLSVPLLATAASMGPGADVQHDDVVVGRLTLSPQWITKTIRPLTKPENLRFIHGYGDSMDPTFVDGDVLLVDAGVQEVKIDGIYVLEANDRLFIKRVRQRLDGSFEISSDNPTVKTVDVLDGTRPVQVRGRVVWLWNGRKM